MSRSELANRFETLLRQTKVTLPFSEEAHLKEQYGMDSVDVMMFLFDVESEFNVKIPDSAVAENGLLRVGNLLDYIEQQGASA